ncbi:Laccase-15 [Dichanthelium oligosanthes]|uniref:laccase n=1 Tax=Dichanthelium oligosanthes TaxID=888268 RepID=A0A1E5UJ65_9POAL|nr:Laccase-15 [Dichanthelium oligosanthes]
MVGEWWEMDLAMLDMDFFHGFLFDQPSASTINGKLGDLHNCSGVVEDGYVLDVEPGKTYLLRVINAGLFSEYYLKIAGHKFTVVAADANYVRPYTTEVVAIAPGETIDALVIANAPPGRYYIVAQPIKTPPPDPEIPAYATRGTLRYKYDHGGSALSSSHGEEEACAHQACRPLVPVRVDEDLFIAIGLGTICRRGGQSCKRSGSDESIQVATLNNVSFHLPAAVAAPLLGAQYYHHNMTGAGVELYTLPDRPPRVFNFTDPGMITWGPKEAPLEPTERATVARRFQYGATVEVVFQSTSLLQSDSNPMHLHGHDVFVLAQGLGNYDPERDMASYNLVDPPVRNTVLVPRLGWVAVRFVADNPGARGPQTKRRQRRRVEGPPPRDEEEEQEQEQEEEQEEEKEKEEEEEQAAMAYPAPGSPVIADRIQQKMALSWLTMDMLQLQYGPMDRVMNCIVNPKYFSATFTITCLLREKLNHRNWTLAKHHRTGNVIIKFLSPDDLRPLHGKAYEWKEEVVSF